MASSTVPEKSKGSRERRAGFLSGWPKRSPLSSGEERRSGAAAGSRPNRDSVTAQGAPGHEPADALRAYVHLNQAIAKLLRATEPHRHVTEKDPRDGHAHYSVTAPLEADDTERAYFAMTPDR